MPVASRKALAVIAAGAFLFLALWFSLSRPPGLLQLSGSTMGTRWQVQLVADDAVRLPGLEAAIISLLQELDRGIFSTWTDSSELSRLNAVAGEGAVVVSPALFEVLQAAQRIHTLSSGAFDPGVAPLVDLWGFGPRPSGPAPDAQEIETARARLGISAVALNGRDSSVRLPARVQLDLSGIAKGYAVDRVASLLEAHGAQHYLVEIGGELRLAGSRPDGGPWRIAIETPESAPGVFAVLESDGGSLALAGSGDYRNFRIVDGMRASHEIDPRSGRPVTHDLAAVTVVAASAMEADAWATALMVLGPEVGHHYADRLGLSAYFIIRAGDGWTVRHSGDFASRLRSAAQEAPAAAYLSPAKE